MTSNALMKGDCSLPLSTIKNIFLIQLGDIGDVVYSFPYARALKEAMPHAKLVFAVREKAAGLTVGCKWIDDVISVDSHQCGMFNSLIFQREFWKQVRNYHFDLAIDMRTGTRGAILALFSGAPVRIAPYAFDGKLWRNRVFTHLVHPGGKKGQNISEYYLETLTPFGIKTDKLDPEVEVSAQHEAVIIDLLEQKGVPLDKPIFVIQPFSLWSYKEWAVEKYINLIRKISDEFDLSVILTGSPDEQKRADEIVRSCGENVFNLAGQTPIELLPALFKLSKLFFGVDSAGLHIAAAAGVPTISLYGPSSSATWAPKGKQDVVIKKDWPCVPCNQKGCDDNLISRCMEELSVGEIYPAVKQQLVKFYT